VVKCSEVLQCSDGLSNKVSNIIGRHIDNMKLLLICILLLSHSFIFFRFYFYQCIFGCILVLYCNLCIFIVMSTYSYRMFMYLHHASWHSSTTPTEVFHAFSSVVRQMPGYNPQRRGKARTRQNFLCCSIYCLFCVALCIVCV